MRLFALIFISGLCLFFIACDKKQNTATEKPVIQVADKDLPTIPWDCKRLDLDMKQANLASQAFFKTRPYRDPRNRDAFLRSAEWKALYEKHFQKELVAFLPYCEPEFINRPQELEGLTQAQLDTFNNIVKDMLGDFIAFPQIKDLADSVAKVYPPDYNFEQALKPALQRFKKLYPAFQVPKVRTMIKAFNPRADWAEQFLYDRLFVNKQYIGITLDYFSGADFKITHPDLPKYLRMRRRPEHLAPAVVGALVDFYRPVIGIKERPTLVDLMIYDGIRLYAMDVLLPETADSLKFPASANQMETANSLAPFIYKAMLPHFFAQNYKTYEWALADGPQTAFGKIGLENVANRQLPSRLSAWMGWQMVRSYMKAHPDVTFEALLKTKDYRAIFQDCGYKPDVPK